MKILLLSVLAVVMIGLMTSNAYATTTTFDEGDEKIILEKTIDVNIILIGDSWLSSQVNSIKKDLVESYEPIYLLTEKKVGIKYNFEYNFLAVTDDDSKKLFDKIYENTIIQKLNGPIAWWLDVYQGLTFELQSDFADDGLLISYNAEDVEEQIYEIIIKNDKKLSSSNTVNLIFLKDVKKYENFLSAETLEEMKEFTMHQNYFVKQTDTVTEKKVTKIGLTGYGGNHNFYFFDLYSMPWIEFDLDGYLENPFDSTKWFYTPLGMENLHDCTTSGCFSEIVIEDVNSAIHHIVTPSFVYPVDYQPNYHLDVIVYNMPMGSSTGVTRSSIDLFIDKDKVISELKSIYPFANFNIEINVENRDSRDISLEFKNAIKKVNNESYETPWGNNNYGLLNSEKIKPHLLSWAQERIETKNLTNTKTIPVLVALYDLPHNLWIDAEGVSGFAPGMADDMNISCCGFAIMDVNQVWDNKLSGTDLVIHEVGHTLGLAHSFSARIGENYEIIHNSFWNNYASPMTYAGPPNGCGWLFEFFHPDEVCGIADASFTLFETNALTDMAVASIIKKTNQNVLEINEIDSSEIDNSKMDTIQSSLSNSKSSFNANMILDKGGAIDNAKNAYLISTKMLGQSVGNTEIIQPESKFGTINLSKNCLVFDKYSMMSIKLSGIISNEIFSKGQPVFVYVMDLDGQYEQEIKIRPSASGEFTSDYIFSTDSGIGKYQFQFEHMNEKSTIESFELVKNSCSVPSIKQPDVNEVESKPAIPSWIKNNAGWWADGTIDDNSFVQGIQFMIKENILSIPNLPESSSETADSVPTWIKNNAGWWADGQIDDNSFVQGIEYLVKVGIIQVN